MANTEKTLFTIIVQLSFNNEAGQELADRISSLGNDEEIKKAIIPNNELRDKIEQYDYYYDEKNNRVNCTYVIARDKIPTNSEQFCRDLISEPKLNDPPENVLNFNWTIINLTELASGNGILSMIERNGSVGGHKKVKETDSQLD